MNGTQGMEDIIIIQVDSNSLSDYLNMIMNAEGRGTLVQSYKSSYRYGYVLLRWSAIIVLYCSKR